MTTQFVEMYHPNIPATAVTPALVATQAVDEQYARGWLLVDPAAPPPVVNTPYYTKEALLSQIQGGAAPIGTALRAAFVAPSQIAPRATGTAATDTTALQAAINATPSGGKLYIPDGTYALNAPLTIARHISIEGESASVAFAPKGTGITNYPPPPYLAGVVLKQTTAGVDCLQITGSAVAANLRNIGIVFADGLASTGHGINATPTATADTGHNCGPMAFLWENIAIQGHDGNHYGYLLTNPMYGELIHCYSYHGGGWKIIGDGSTENWGNLVFVNPYVLIDKAGSAGGYCFSSGGITPSQHPSAGDLNLMVFIRPQCNMQGAGSNTTQPTWDEHQGNSVPTHVTVIGADFESNGGNPFRPGLGTDFLGNSAVAGQNVQLTSLGVGALKQTTTTGQPGIYATAIGNQTLAANTTGVGNVAVGGAALGANTTGSNNTAVGNTAAQSSTTAGDVTAIGASALNTNTAGGVTAVGSNAARNNTTAVNTTAVGSYALNTNQTGASNTAIGAGAFGATTGASNTGVGAQAASVATTGWNNTIIGQAAGNNSNPLTTGGNNTFIGYRAGLGGSAQSSQATAIGYQAVAGGGSGNGQTAIGAGTSATGNGSVAIGCDNSGASASATSANQFALGTPLHQVQISNNTTGAGSAALGANCPATTATAPYTWFKMLSNDGSTVYVPAWK